MLDACTQNPAIIFLAFVGSVAIFIIGFLVLVTSQEPSKPKKNSKKLDFHIEHLRKLIRNVKLSGRGGFHELFHMVIAVQGVLLFYFTQNFIQNIKNKTEKYDDYFPRLRILGIPEEEIYPALKILAKNILSDIEKWERMKNRTEKTG